MRSYDVVTIRKQARTLGIYCPVQEVQGHVQVVLDSVIMSLKKVNCDLTSEARNSDRTNQRNESYETNILLRNYLFRVYIYIGGSYGEHSH